MGSQSSCLEKERNTDFRQACKLKARLLLLCAGSPPLGSRGTVVGVHEGALEVLFDVDFIGGGDLQGRCQGRCGIMLAPADLLNLAKPHFINLQGNLCSA